MPELSYSISGDNSGLLSATNRAIANIENLTNAVNNANVSLQFKNGIAALDTLGQKLLVAQGNASLFGDSIQLQTQQISAYQTALNSLLSNGFDPMSDDVQKLKNQIDSLNSSLQATKGVQLPKSFVNDTSTAPSPENIQNNNIGSVSGQSQFVTALNEQLSQGIITIQEYNQALQSANSTANTLASTTNQTAEAIAQEDGYLAGLKIQLNELNQQKLNAPFEDLSAINIEIKEIETAISNVSNIGKEGFNDLGIAIDYPLGSLGELKQSLKDLQTQLTSTNDRNEIANLNTQIDQLKDKIIAIGNIGKEGFDAFGNEVKVVSTEIQVQLGIIQTLSTELSELKQIRPLLQLEEDLVQTNAQIQELELSLQQASNIGKVGFDEMGNSIKGVSLQNVNGQLIALSNNLFGARQIAKDVVRTFDAGSLSGYARGIGLLAVDFLYYAQNAQFAAGATATATVAIGAESGVATTAGISTAALGAAFTSLLTPVNLIILGVALLGGGFLAYEKSQKSATSAAQDHEKELKKQKDALDAYISTLSESEQAEAKAANTYGDQISKLNLLYDALENQVTANLDYTKALSDLQNEFPTFFGNLDNATIKTDALKTAFEDATKAFQALGIVQATQSLSTPLYENIASNTVAQKSIQPKIDQLKAQLSAGNAQDQGETSVGSSAIGGGVISQNYTYLSQLQKQYDDLITKSKSYGDSITDSKNKLEELAKVGASNQIIADGINQKYQGIIGGLEAQLATLKKIEPTLKTQEQINDNIAQQKTIQAQIDEDEGKNAISLLNSKTKELSIQQQIADILSKSGADAEKSGLTGYALSIANITTKYDAFYTSLDKVGQKIAQQAALFTATNRKRGLAPIQASNDTSSLNSAYGTLTGNESKQLSDAQIADAQTTADAITKINNEFGVKQQAGYNEELSRIKSLYDGIIAQANSSTQTLDQIQANYQLAISKSNGDPQAIADANTNLAAQLQQYKDSQTKIAAAHADLLPAIQAIDAKYIEQEQQTYDKIVDIANQALIALDDGEESRTDKINSEWQKRITSANAYFDKLKDLAVASKLPQSAVDNINSVQSQVNNVLNAADFKQVSEEISKNFASAMQSAIQGFVSDFYTSITTLGTTRQTIDEKYNLQLQAQQASYLSGTSNITAAQNASTVAQINNLKQLELASTTSFGAIFSSLVSKFNSSFNQSILQSFTKQFTENLGKTLLTPSSKQLSISPEEQSAQQVSSLLKSAGSSLADQIKQAGIDFYNTIKTGGISGGLLSGTSSGSSLVHGLTATPGGSGGTNLLGGTDSAAASGLAFSTAVDSSAATFQAGSATAAENITQSGITFSDATTTASGHISSAGAGIAAAASLFGGLVSGATSPTSSVGQGIGGAISGAGEGALIGTAIAPGIGTAIGAVAGGLIGGISGLLSASKAKKALQEQQLEQAQQQTALLQASLAYTSQIVGRDTSQGIVTGISVGAFGQLTATVSGKDLQFVLDRNANGR